MAVFNGFTCDDCSAIVPSDDRTRVTTKITGPVVEGEFSKDLCAECAGSTVPDGVTLRPLRRRTSATDGGQDNNQQPAPSGQGVALPDDNGPVGVTV